MKANTARVLPALSFVLLLRCGFALSQEESRYVVAPGTQGSPPSDAIVLFDGKDLAEFRSAKGGEATWQLKNGAVSVRRGAGDMYTKRAFGDIQLHFEWRIPAGTKGSGEGRGNSGIKLHSAYEIQILDSYAKESRSKGQAGAIYAQTPPYVNACRKPGDWQSYDIVFRAPYFDATGKLLKRGTVTVLHNGVLVQDHEEILGRTNSKKPVSPEYKQPFFLQDHGAPVSYRNIWVRELERKPLPKTAG